MSSSMASEIASTLQSASIKRHPSPSHDLNPSTAASSKQPVRFSSHQDPDADSNVDEDEIPLSALEPVPRRSTMPPLPDMRFEQSYLKSIEHAEGWKGVLWITVRDQVRYALQREGDSPWTIANREKVIICFAQGVLWQLILNGWRHWNKSAKFSGKNVGSKIRRWWWGVNGWAIPTAREVSVDFLNV